jgi:hypothetical protein
MSACTNQKLLKLQHFLDAIHGKSCFIIKKIMLELLYDRAGVGI